MKRVRNLKVNNLICCSIHCQFMLVIGCQASIHTMTTFKEYVLINKSSLIRFIAGLIIGTNGTVNKPSLNSPAANSVWQPICYSSLYCLGEPGIWGVTRYLCNVTGMFWYMLNIPTLNRISARLMVICQIKSPELTPIGLLSSTECSSELRHINPT